MNIDDFKKVDLNDPKADRLDLIFARQAELMEKYDQIEVNNGFRMNCPTVPIDLNNKFGQYLLKDFAWRITEELGEALEAFIIHQDTPQHCDEEIADGLHFLTEFTILSGTPTEMIAKADPEFYYKKDKLAALYFLSQKEAQMMVNKRSYIALAYRVGRFIESLAKTCNCLKNKPWKQSQMITDEDYFRKNLCEAWIRFIQICICADISSPYLFDLYFRKSEVNKFRQRSNY